MAGWGEALMILGGAGAGGFKAAGDVAEEEVKGIKKDMLQAALDKRATNLERWKAGESEKEREFKAGESKLGRESAERIAKTKAGAPGAFEEKYNLLVKIYGKDKAKSLIESSLDKSKTGATAKSKIDALTIAYELRDMGSPLEDINQVLKAGGVEEWVSKKIMKIEKGLLRDTKVEEEIFGPPEKKGLLGGASGGWQEDFGKREDGTQKDEEVKGGTSLDELLSLVGDQPTATQKPGLLEKPLTKEKLGSILEKPKTYQTGMGFKPETYKPGATPSIKERIQGWASQTQSEKGRKFGEGNLEAAIRQAGFGKDLAEVKDMAANLKKRYPDLSEEQLIELVKKVAAEG